MADKEIKITTLTEQQREVLKSKTPFILPDNPSQKGYSASQIKKTMYEPVLLLFDWLKRQGLETKEAFEYLNNYIFEKGNDLSEDIENSKKYAKDLVDNLALTVSDNLTESKNYTDLEIDKVELDYNNKFANVTKDVTEKHQAVTKRLDEHDIDIKELTKTLKAKCACGGTAKNGQIELQGDHKVRVKEVLSELGFSSDTIEIRESKKNNKKRR